jgi:hypothetical protein
LAAAVAVAEAVAVVAPHLAVVAEPLVLPVRAHLEAVVAQALAPVLPVRAHLVLLQLLQAVVVPLVLPVRAHLVLLALVGVVVVLVAVEVEAVAVQPLHLLSRQSLPAAMARSTT